MNSSHLEPKTTALKKIEEKKFILPSAISKFATDQTILDDNSFSVPNRAIYPSNLTSKIRKDLPEMYKVLETSIDYMKANTDELEQILENLKNEEDFQDIHMKLLAGNKCSRCRKRELVTMSNCGHLFCKKCANDLIIQNKGCESCQVAFSHDFKVVAAVKSNNFYTSQAKILCLSCETREIDTLFEETCNHLCLNCVSKCYHSNENYCPACWAPLFKSCKYLEKLEDCQGCSKRKNWVTDYFGISKCHKMCGECLEESIENKSCKVCNKTFNCFDVLQILGQVSQQCGRCRQIISRKDLIRGDNCFICKNCESFK